MSFNISDILMSIIMQIMHSTMLHVFIYPTILSHMKKNGMLFINIYGFVRFIYNIFTLEEVIGLVFL